MPKVVAMGGDGGTSDIGLQALSGALERDHHFIYICCDNEAYMNTGIQRSSATPFGAMTTTSPPGKRSFGQITWKKNMAAIAVAHGIPYVATASPGYLFDLYFKVKKAVETPGPAYINILSVCPTGWRCATDLSVRLARLATETAVFPCLKWWTASTGSRWSPPKSGPSGIISNPRAASGISGTPRWNSSRSRLRPDTSCYWKNAKRPSRNLPRYTCLKEFDDDQPAKT